MPPKVSTPAIPENPAPGDVLSLWQEAQRDFYAEVGQFPGAKSKLETLAAPQKWLLSFQKAREPNAKYAKVSKLMCGHIQNIQVAIEVLQLGTKIVTTVRTHGPIYHLGFF